LGQKSTRSIENAKMLSRNPNVAFAIYDQNNPYDMVSVRGKVVEQVNGDAVEKHYRQANKEIHGVRQISWSFGRRKRRLNLNWGGSC
jgi:hypothetical protein